MCSVLGLSYGQMRMNKRHAQYMHAYVPVHGYPLHAPIHMTPHMLKSLPFHGTQSLTPLPPPHHCHGGCGSQSPFTAEHEPLEALAHSLQATLAPEAGLDRQERALAMVKNAVEEWTGETLRRLRQDRTEEEDHCV